MSLFLAMMGAALANPATELPEVPAAYEIKATAGRSTVEAAAPSYCHLPFTPLSTTYAELGDLQDTVRLEKYVETGSFDPLHALFIQGERAATMACSFADDPVGQGWMRSYKQAFHNLTGAPAPLVERLFALALEHGRDLSSMSNNGPDDMTVASYASEREVELHRAMLQFVRTRGDRVSANDVAWWLDRRHELSELERGMLLRAMLNGRMEDRSEGLARFLFVAADIDAFDPGKVEAELKEAGFREPWLSLGAFQAYQIKTEALEQKAAWAARAKEMPELVAIREAAAKGYAEWQQIFGGHAAGFEAAWAVEDGVLSGRKSKLEGCSEKLDGFFTAFVSETSPKSREAYERMLAHPYMSTLLGWMSVCEAKQEHEERAELMSHLATMGPLGRGPRTAAVLAALPEVVQAKEDFDRFPYVQSDMLPFATNGSALFVMGDDAPLPTMANAAGLPRGTIASLKPVEGGVQVTFKPIIGSVPTFTCVTTNRVNRILSDGSVSYQQDCKTTGSATVNEASKPFVVDRLFAGGLKPGMYVEGFNVYDGPGFAFMATSGGASGTVLVTYGHRL